MFSTNIPTSLFQRLECLWRKPSTPERRQSTCAMLTMPNILKPVQSPADVRQNVQTFNFEAAQFYDRAARLLRETTYWVYDPTTESFRSQSV